eukprot:GILK01003531.1.p1 GENE.GILK01003531.1~~GILK01003531.1.p1  ORF type:complete len:667 (+),score=165.78 GILK01003531.1:30-2003(+)
MKDKKKRSRDEADSDDDMEEELLNVSNKKQMKKGTQKKHSQKRKKRSSSDEESDQSESSMNSPSDSSDSSDAKPTKRAAKPKKAKTRAGAQKGSGGKSASADEDEETFVDKYGPDLMGGEEDRNMMARLTEIEREAILAERHEERERLRTQFEIRQRKKRDMRDKGDEDENDSRRTRVRVAGEVTQTKAKSALSDLKSKRERAKEKEAEARKERERRRDVSESSASSSSSEEDQDDEDETEKPRRKKKGDVSAGEAEDSQKKSRDAEQEWRPSLQLLNAVRVTRNDLETWFDRPFFDKTIVGAFVRINIGIGKDNTPQYRIAEVMDIPSYPYSYPLGKVDVQRGLMLRNGKAVKAFKMNLVSNGDFTEKDYDMWVKQMKGNVPFPQEEELQEKLLEIEKARTSNWTHEEVELQVKLKKEQRSVPTNIALEKAELLRQRIVAHETAQLTGAVKDIAALDAIDKRIEELEALHEQNKAKFQGGSTAAEQQTKKVTVGSISSINQRNKSKQQEIEFSKAKSALKAVKSGKKGFDPFARRECNPRIMWNTGESETPKSSQPAASPRDATNDKGVKVFTFEDKMEVDDNGSLVPIICKRLIEAHKSIDYLDINVRENYVPSEAFSLIVKPSASCELQSRMIPVKGQRLSLSEWRAKMNLNIA